MTAITKSRRRYRIGKGDFVKDSDGRLGFALTVGAVGGQIEAVVKWLDANQFEYVPLERLKRTFMVVERDPDT